MLLSFFLCAFSYGQSFQTNKIVVDKDTGKPLENVAVYNQNDYSTTNSEGKFVFVSQTNEINLNLLGYERIETTFDKLKNDKDTIFMEIKTFQLREVAVGNADAYMKKVYDKFDENALQSYTIDFFLRNVFKKKQAIILLQDIYARKNQGQNSKNKIAVEILNMRKTSLFEKQDKISFEFPNFDGLFNVLVPQIGETYFTETSFNDDDFKKILFESKEKDQWGQIWKGYFVVNRKDYAIVEYTLSMIDDPEKIPFKKLPSSKGEYRTTKLEKFTQFTKDAKTNKYYLSKIKVDNQVEIVAHNNSEKPFCYDFTMDFFVTSSPTNKKVISNFATGKDIFRARFPYSKDFWNHQNQLPLTKELELFLKSVIEKKDQTDEFQVIGNF